MLTESPGLQHDGEQREAVDFAAQGARKKSARKRNHWATRIPDDYVSYPRLPALGYLAESKLIARAQAGDTQARNDVWMHYARLTFSVVNRFRVPENLLADAIQEGCMGLARAIEKFEIERCHSFSTYAWYWIFQSIQRFLANHLLPIHLPSYLYQDYMRLRRELAHCATVKDELAVRERWHHEDSRRYARLARAHATATLTPIQRIPKRKHPQTREDEIEDQPNWILLCEQALQTLRPRERTVIEKRFGLTGARPMTLREIGQELQLSRERIRQIQQSVKTKLRRRFAEGSQFVAMLENRVSMKPAHKE